MKSELETIIANVCKELYGDKDIRIELTRPEEQFGDYASNVALQIAGQSHSNPRVVAEAIVEKLRSALGSHIQAVTIAGPGFINLTLTDSTLATAASKSPTIKPRSYNGKVVVAEYSDANPFKVMHAGHVYTTVVGGRGRQAIRGSWSDGPSRQLWGRCRIACGQDNVGNTSCTWR